MGTNIRVAGAAVLTIAILSLAIGVGLSRRAAHADVDHTIAISCLFLGVAIDGDATDTTVAADVDAACDGLPASDVELLALALGDNDGRLEPGELDELDLDAVNPGAR